MPQIPNDLIRRFTQEGDVVLDMFMGSGTTLFECVSLGRKYIGFDINESIVDEVYHAANEIQSNTYRIHLCDICDREEVQRCILADFSDFSSKAADIVFSHPPYLDIIRFTDHDCDLSHISDLSLFTARYMESVNNVWTALKKGGFFILVVGDAYKKGEIVPLGFTLMNAIKHTFKCQLKGIVVKDIVGNRAKIGQEALWRYRAMKWGTYLFKHEYIFVLKKQ